MSSAGMENLRTPAYFVHVIWVILGVIFAEIFLDVIVAQLIVGAFIKDMVYYFILGGS